MKHMNVRRKASAALFAGALVFSSISTPILAKDKIDTTTGSTYVKPMDKDSRKELSEKIATAEKIDKAMYTNESYQAFYIVVTEAKETEKNTSADDAALKAAIVKLNTAFAALVPIKDNVPLDKNNLADGTYEVGVNLWNADADKPSMADSSFIKTALIVVKSGVYKMYIRTKPMTLGTITASLQELKVKVKDGYEVAKIESMKDGNPTSFSFTLPTKEMYVDVMVNPKVTIMGDRDIAARIKVDYSKLKRVSGNVDKPQADQGSGQSVTNSATGIKVDALSGTLPEGASLQATPLKDNAKVNKALQSITTKFVAYDISFLKDGMAVQLNGKVRVSIPMPNGYNKTTLQVYYINEKGEAKLVAHKMSGDMVTFETTHFSTFAIAQGKDTVIKATGAQTSNYVGLFSLIIVSLAGTFVYKTRRKFFIK